MANKLTNKKAKEFFKYQKDDFAIYINDEENEAFEDGALASSAVGGNKISQ